MNRAHLPRLAITAVVAALALLTTACGDDDADEAESTTTEAPAEAEGASAEEFCEAGLEVETIIASEEGDPTEALAELESAAPEGSEETVATMVEEGKKALEAEEAPGDEFMVAYNEYLDVVRENCDFGEVGTTAKEYEFAGVPAELEAGGTIFTITNEGAEAHEMAIMRVNDDVTESVDELLALPQEEAEAKVTNVGGTFAMPGGNGGTIVDLEPGRFIVACFVPVGMTPEVIAAMEAGGPEHEGPPHAMQGMVTEFTVS